MIGKEEHVPGFKKYLGMTILTGLGFFTVGLMDPLYDNYVPLFLSWHLPSKFMIGLIMTLDNIFALFLIPLVAALSDRTRTPIGRRMPYILVTLPLTAIAFGFIPFAAIRGLIPLIILLFLLNIVKQSARGPVVALMPDIIPGEYRSEANGVINMMGGIAAIAGTLGLARLMNVAIRLPGQEPLENVLPFPVAGLLVILATLSLFLFVKEKQRATSKEEEAPQRIITSLKFIFSSKDRSAILILFSLLLWFLAYHGILPFLSLYAIKFLHVSEGSASLPSGMVAVAYALFSIPSGMFAHRFGRKLTIRICLAGLSLVLLLLFLHPRLAALLHFGGSANLLSFLVLMFLFGLFFGSVATNSFPMLWEMAGFSNIGIYTGLYYFFSQSAAIASPPFTGWMIDKLGYSSVFLFGSLCMLAAFGLMNFVKSGEAGKKGETADA